MGCGGASEPVLPYGMAKVDPVPQTGPAGGSLSEMPIVIVIDAEGKPVPDQVVNLDVELGGGKLEALQVATDENGLASLPWILGPAPVKNRLRVTLGPGAKSEASEVFDVMGELSQPVVPEFFGDVHAFMTDHAIEGSTEDLAFDDTGRLLLGVPGGLLSMDTAGGVKSLELTGAPLEGPLGIALDDQGNIWVADGKGKALRKVDTDGQVQTVLESDGIRDLEGPNYVAIGPGGDVYLSDPCVGEIIRYDPAEQKIVALLSFSLLKEGGPNGFAFDSEGDRMFVLTENTGVLCGHGDVDMKSPIAGLFEVEVTADGFGSRTAVATGIGLFGDGMAFDAEGNLYVIVDRLLEGAFALDDSAVWVLPEGGDELVKFASLEDPLVDGILANLAFGKGDFGASTLYIALLSMPPFNPPEKRGVMRVEVGIEGQPLFR